jgi:hypothetical protein
VTLYGSAPDPLYIRSRGEEGIPMGCGDASCLCGGGPDVRRATAWRRGRHRPPVTSADSEQRAAKDPRFSWLPPI